MGARHNVAIPYKMQNNWDLLTVCSPNDVPTSSAESNACACSACLSDASTCDFEHHGTFAPLPGLAYSERSCDVTIKHSASHARDDGLLHLRRIADLCRVAVHIIIPRESATRIHTTCLETITRRLIGGKRLSTRVVADILFQLVCATSYASDRGVLHLHINPSNIRVNFPSHHVHLAGWDDATHRLTRYSAPCLFFSPMSVTRQHSTADVWSLGVVVAEALRGKPLVVTHPGCEEVHHILGKLFQSLGTPSYAAIVALDPTAAATGDWELPRVIHRPQLSQLLRGSRISREGARIVGQMLDWNPVTRLSPTSMIRLPFFYRNPSFETSQTDPVRRRSAPADPHLPRIVEDESDARMRWR